MMKSVEKLKKDKSGFLLMDGLIAVLIIGLALCSLAYWYIQGTETRYNATQLNKAVHIAAERLELMKTMDGKNITVILDFAAAANTNKTVVLDGETFEAEIDTTVLTRAVGSDAYHKGDKYLVPVEVKVTWKDTKEETLIMRTYISREV